MGTWGSGGFENDAGADLLPSLRTPADLIARLGTLPAWDAAIDVDAAQTTIAAAEAVAAMLGRPAPDLGEADAARIAGFGPPEAALTEAARDAVSRVLAGSELLDLWAQSDASDWNRAVTGLIERLNPDIPFAPMGGRNARAILQTCSFCNLEISEAELVMISLHRDHDIINQLDCGFWCHLACLNENLHPRHLVQPWLIDPEAL